MAEEPPALAAIVERGEVRIGAGVFGKAGPGGRPGDRENLFSKKVRN